jgi:hypothetical protein
MASLGTFDFTSAELEAATSLDRAQARGTLRLALNSAGVDPATVNREQMSVVLQKVVPEELRMCGVENAEAICERLVTSLRLADLQSDAVDRPEDVFARLEDA